MKTSLLWLSLAAWLGTSVMMSAAEPKLLDREPKSGEIGYRPPDGSITRLNPPSLIWLHEPSAAAYTLQWSRQNDFKESITVSNFVWNTYTHYEVWPAGSYWWRYRFTTKDRKVSNWSKARSVTVPVEAVEMPMPTRAQQRDKISASHPRLFLQADDLAKLRQLAQGREKKRFTALQAAANQIILAGPTPEPQQMGSARDKDNAELVKYWWPNRVQTEKACMEAETLAFVYLLTGDRKYGEAARRWILHLAAWNPDGPTNFKLNCEAAKPMLFRPARAYDWAWDMFTAEDRQVIQSIIRRRVQDAWESGEVGRGVGHLNSPYSSHGNRVWHKIGEAGIAFLGEVPEAETWLDYALNKFYACYPVWSDDDGGWHEGVSYWSGYMNKAVWWLQVAQSALGIDGLKKPFFAQVGDYPLYVTPPHSPNSGFGDLSFRPPSSGIGGFMDYHIRVKGNQPDGDHAAYWRWWTEQWGMRSESGILGFLYAANLPDPPAPKPPTHLPTSKIFHGIGVASLHTTLLDARDDIHLLFKSSPFGTQSHGHNPHNSFQLNAFGESLLTTCVYRDLHGSKFHYGWAHSTMAHNAVLVNGEGQIKHTAAPHGRIADSRLTPEYDYVLGEATAAYGGKLKRYHRHVLFVKSAQPVIVIYDDLAAHQLSTFQFMLHALKEFSLNSELHSLQVDHPGAGVIIQYLSPAPLRFRQWNGYNPPPSKETPQQWHVEAGTVEKRDTLGILTVIVPYRTGQAPKEWKAHRIESESALGIKLNFGGQTRLLGFRKSDHMKTSELEGQSFEGPVWVESKP